MSTVCECNKFEMVDTKDVFYMLREGSTPIIFDPVPTEGSMNLLTSGTIYNALENIDSGVTSVNGQTGDVVLDAGDIAYESTTVEEELGTINSALSSLQSVTEIIDTASGAIASFPDGSGLPMRSLVAQINPVQDLHGQSNPYPAGGGKNKIDEDTVWASLLQSDGSFLGRGGDVSPIKCYIPSELVGTQLTFSAYIKKPNGSSISNIRVEATAGGSSNIGNVVNSESYTLSKVTFTPTATSDYVRIAYGDGSTENLQFKDVQLEAGSSATSFAPYSNLCPITGWTGLSGKRCGKNLFDTASAGNEWVTSGGYIITKDSAKSVRLDCKAGEVFTLSNKNTASGTNILVIACFDANNTMLSRDVVSSSVKSVTATVPNRASFLIACFNDWSLVEEAQLEVGSTATAYEAPATSLPITCTWQTEAGTVYGGTVDVVTGVLTVTHRYVLLDGTQTINKHSTTAYNGFHLNLANNGLPACASTEDGTVGQFSYYKLGKLINANGNAFVGANTIQFRNDSLTTKDEAIAYLTANPLQVVYPLAQPQTYQLTPQQILTLLGNNTVFVDTGDVSVTYQASIKGYIDKVLGQ